MARGIQYSILLILFPLILMFQNCQGIGGTEQKKYFGNGEGYLGIRSLWAQSIGNYDPTPNKELVSGDEFYRYILDYRCGNELSHAGKVYSENGSNYYLSDRCSSPISVSSYLRRPYSSNILIYNEYFYIKNDNNKALDLNLKSDYPAVFCKSDNSDVKGHDVLVYQDKTSQKYFAKVFIGKESTSGHEAYIITDFEVEKSQAIEISFSSSVYEFELRVKGTTSQNPVSGQLVALISDDLFDLSMTCYQNEPSQVSLINSIDYQILGGTRDSTMIKLESGSVLAWGRNNLGQTGVGSNLDMILNPMNVKNQDGIALQNINKITSSISDHACGLSGSTAYCWGVNGNAELGLEVQGLTYRFAQSAFEGLSVNQLELGPLNTFVQLVTGEWYFVGFNGSAAAAVDGPIDKTYIEPELASLLPDEFSNLRPQYRFACGVSNQLNSEVTCWGLNSLGTSGTTSVVSVVYPDLAYEVNQVKGLAKLQGVHQVEVGEGSVCALTRSGRVVCWGDNLNGQTGSGSLETRVYLPEFVYKQDGSFLTNIVLIKSGSFHSCALSIENKVYCWGNNSVGQAGNSEITNKISKAREVSFNWPEAVSDFHLGRDHSCASILDGSVFCWGANSYGKLGLGNQGGLFFIPQKVNF